MSKLEKHKEKARSLETKDPRAAIEVWLEALKAQEDDGDPNPDLSIFNRIGDLYLKVKDPAQAADYYDRAVDKYAELGFHNNAIAMCNKVLRNAPARQTTYLKLAKLYAAKGFMAEAKQNFLEYAERMQKAGKIEQAFAALKELADISAESAHLREMLEEHLRMYGAPERRPAAPAAPPKAEPRDDPTKSSKRKSSSLVILEELEPTVSEDASAADVDEELEPLLDVEIESPAPPLPKGTPTRPGAPMAPPGAASRPAVGPPPRAPGPKAPAPKFSTPRAEPPKVKPVVPKRPPAAPPDRKTLVEVPPLELEPDFDTGTTDEAHEVDDQPLASEETPAADVPAGFIQTEADTSITPPGRRSAAIDL